jgi:hypothetical protein
MICVALIALASALPVPVAVMRGLLLALLLLAVQANPSTAAVSTLAAQLKERCVDASERANSYSEPGKNPFSKEAGESQLAVIDQCTKALNQIAKEMPEKGRNRVDHYAYAAGMYLLRAYAYSHPTISRFSDATRDCQKSTQFAKAAGDRRLIQVANDCLEAVEINMEIRELIKQQLGR